MSEEMKAFIKETVSNMKKMDKESLLIMKAIQKCCVQEMLWTEKRQQEERQGRCLQLKYRSLGKKEQESSKGVAKEQRRKGSR